MNRLVVHQIYANGMAFDLSGFRNHGVPYAVSQAIAPFAPGFDYTQQDSRVIVAPSTSLEDLLAVRAIVTFYLNPSGGLTRRYNLIEGHLCFALFVNPDGSLSGTILDADGNWAGAQSSANAVSTGRWHQAELRHDGVNQCSIYLDGVPVGTSYAANGPVTSVGPNGIAIGHWPEPSGQYTFDGYIREVWVYKYDPALAAKGLLVPCCGRARPALDEVAATLRAEGYTAEKARSQGMALMKFGLSVSAKVRGTDPTRSQKHATLSAQALAAFERGDSAAYSSALTQLAIMAATTLSAADQQQIHQQETELVKGLPLTMKKWQSLISNMCLARAKADPQSILTAVTQALATGQQPQSKQKEN
ncbi:MAG: LamG-like jellyroll fold domain-containing protein [Acidobacteriaceae bacterium]